MDASNLTMPTPEASNTDDSARDVLADAAHVFLAAQQPVMVESLRPRPVVAVAPAAGPDVPVPLAPPAGAPEQLMRELDDLAGL